MTQRSHGETISLLDGVIEHYRSMHGDPEYHHFKRLIIWTKERRKPGYHVSPIGDGQPVSKEEYEANIAESNFNRGEAFMSRLPRNYWEYHRKLTKDGWRERLMKDVEAYNAHSEKTP